MSRNNTGNPLDSRAFPDFEDNVKNLDIAANGTAESWADRFGKPRKTLHGMEVEHEQAQLAYRQAIRDTGLQVLGDYSAGIEFTDYNQAVRLNGEFWKPSASTVLPYTTTGAGMPEDDAFVAVGDAVLRQELADSDSGKGAAIVGWIRGAIGAVARSVAEWVSDNTVRVADFMSKAERADALLPDPLLDHTSCLAKAINAANKAKTIVRVSDGYTLNISRISLPESDINLYCDGSAAIRALDGSTVPGQALLQAKSVVLNGGITVNGRNYVGRLFEATNLLELSGITAMNVKGSATSFGVILRASGNTKLRVIGCHFSDVSGINNGTEGDISGSDCGLYVESTDFIVRDNVFERIGSYEDGDGIRIQLPADAVYKWASVRTGVVKDNRFPDIKKRAVKVQASGCKIDNNYITSSTEDEFLCPYAAIEIFGSGNKVTGNQIFLARAVAGISDAGNDNEISGANTVEVGVGLEWTTARLSTSAGIIAANAQRSKIKGNIVKAGGYYGIYLTNDSSNCLCIGNTLSYAPRPSAAAIYISGGSGNTQSHNVIQGTDTNKFAHGIYASNSPRNAAINNTIGNTVVGVRYFGASSLGINRGNTLIAGVSNAVSLTGVPSSTASSIRDYEGFTTATIDPGVIGAGSTYITTIDWPPVTYYVPILGTPITSIEAGLVYNVDSYAPGVITLRITNVRDTSITATPRSWRFRRGGE